MKKTNITVLLLITVILMLFLSGCSESNSTTIDFDNATLAVRVLQSGKSDCIFVDIEGYTVLIDCADEDDFPMIDQMLKESEVSVIDLLIITHFDNDHIGSADDILNNYSVGELVMPSYVRHSKPMRNLLEAIENNSSTKVSKLEGADYEKELENGIKIEINTPKNNYGIDDNANSLISVITLPKNEKLLFAGDATKERLGEFLERDANSYVFAKMPHHGEYNTEVKRLMTHKDLLYAAVTVGTLDDAETKLLTLAKTLPVKTLYTCDGEIVLLYKDGKFEFYQ